MERAMTGAKMQAPFLALCKRLSHMTGDTGKVCTLMHGAILGVPGLGNGNRPLCIKSR